MKVVVSFIVVLSLFFLRPLDTSARSVTVNNTVTTKVNVNERVQVKLEEKEQERVEMLEKLRERIREKVATREARLQETRKERIRVYFNHVYDRFGATIKRLRILTTRIETRLVKLKEQGKDTAQLEGQVAKAKGLLDKSQANLDAAKLTLEDVLSSKDPKESFMYTKEVLGNVRTELKEAHSILVKVVTQIEGLRVGENKK